MPIWQKTMDLAVKIFSFTENLPKKEDYGFTSQIRRSALSIPANIAEAFGRHHTLEKINFYYMARGSLTETQSHLEYGKRVGYIADFDFEVLDRNFSILYNDINKIIKKLKVSNK
ncbi:MAG: four helix bundle protein [Nitrospirota bacterium]